MSAEREESLAEYAMRVTLERDEALRQLRTAEQAMWEHIAGCSGYKPKREARVRNRQNGFFVSADGPRKISWSILNDPRTWNDPRLAMTNVSPLLSEMGEDKP